MKKDTGHDFIVADLRSMQVTPQFKNEVSVSCLLCFKWLKLKKSCNGNLPKHKSVISLQLIILLVACTVELTYRLLQW